MSSNRSIVEIIRATLALVVTVALAGCGGGGGTSPGSEMPPPPVATGPADVAYGGTWVVMGSSTAAGAGAGPGKGWASLLGTSMSSYGVTLANIAKGGSVSYEGLTASSPAVPGRPAPDPAANIDQALGRKPVLLLVSYPTNDTAKGYGTDEIVNNILAIRTRALAAGVPVVVLSTQPRNVSSEKLNQLKEIDQRLSAQVSGCFVAVNAGLAGVDGHLAREFDSGDGVHPSDAGHRYIATRVQQVLESGACVRLQTRK